MDVFIYCADIYCDKCGKDIRKRLRKAGEAPANPKDETTYDSNEYPKGPYGKGGGEADSPQHCGSQGDCLQALVLSDGTKVGVWLENDLTDAGVKYVREYIADDPENEVTQLWAEWYKEELAN